MFRSIIALFFLIMISCPVSAADQQETQKATGWETQLQSLLKEHGELLSKVVEAEYYNKPRSEVSYLKQALFSNSHDLATLFTSLQGSKAAHEFEPLFDHHITIGSEYISAAKQHLPTSQLTEQALENGNQIADLFSRWFPSIHNTQWRKMMADHVTLEAQLADAYFNNDVGKALTIKEQTITQLAQLGDLLIQGIKKPSNAANNTKQKT